MPAAQADAGSLHYLAGLEGVAAYELKRRPAKIMAAELLVNIERLAKLGGTVSELHAA